ncbi:hypothetical protein DYB32_009510 [Aphanomyces invadans]|uniref:FYVE-type domain-containing protein n=1 Tax=Aphanomyces invadans TaxID=157072 RepID=A0A3R7A2T9_9STRA|nr:hypothetical protein DYB32_009510 [Aphanomyces invadans]
MTLHSPPTRPTSNTATTTGLSSLLVDPSITTQDSENGQSCKTDPPTPDDLDGVGVHWMSLKPSRAMESSYKSTSMYAATPSSRCDVVFTSYSQMYEPATTDDDDDDDDESASRRRKVPGGIPLVPTRRNSPLVTCGTHIWDSSSLSIAVASTSIDRRRLALVQGHGAPGHRRLAFHHSGVYVEKVRTPTHADLTSITLVMSLSEVLPCTESESNHRHRQPRRPFYDVSPSRPVTQWMQRLVLSVLNLSRLARQGNHHKNSLVPKHKWAMDAICGLCDQSFNLFRRRHHCRLCGNAICSACSCSMDVEFPILADGRILPQTTVRSCTKCAFVGSTMQRLPAAMLANHDFFSRPQPPPMRDEGGQVGVWSTAPGRLRTSRRHVVASEGSQSHSRHHHAMLEPQRHKSPHHSPGSQLASSMRRSAHISLIDHSPRLSSATPRMCRTPQPVKSTAFSDLSGGTGMTRLDRQDRMFRRDLRDSWENLRGAPGDDAIASFQAFPLVGSRGVRRVPGENQDKRETPRSARRMGPPPLAHQVPSTTNSFPSILSSRGIQARRMELLELANRSPSNHQTLPEDRLEEKGSMSRESTDSEEMDPAATPRGRPPHSDPPP